MFDVLLKLLVTLNGLTPLGVIGLLGVIILLLVHKRGPLQTLKNNHLQHIENSLSQIAENSTKQVEILYEVKGGIEFLKGRRD